MRDWNFGDENGLNSIPSHLDWIDDDLCVNRDNPKKDDNDDLDDVPF